MPDGLVGELESQGFAELSITATAPTMPPHHRDPFGRMLEAQAQLESLVLVTADKTLASYDVEQFDDRS